ncbi:zinc-finger domain-containing protein [Reyranella sp.]|uniref:zinc-finger domain-containing protein n=1 Tax=Reyranella sp. TaxID=1929291 RepID=UPI003D0FB2F6
MTAAAVTAIIRRRERKEVVTEPFELISVDTDRVACDGGGGPLGHPKVYLNLGEEGRVECPYCSRTYVLREGARSGRGAGAHAH